MIDVVKEAFDVDIQPPVKSPAALARHRNRLMARSARPVSVGVPMEVRIDLRFQTLFHHHLSHPVRDGGYPKRAFTTAVLRYFHTFDGRRVITSGGQSVPELVEVAFQRFLKLLDRLPIHTRRAAISLDLLIGFPDLALRNTKRFGALDQILPLPVG